MSDSILNRECVIKLNKLWQPYALMTVKSAFTFLCSEADGEKPGFAIDFETVTDDKGECTIAYTNVLSMEEWMALPVREGDWSVGIGRDPVTGIARRVRVPLVVICANYDRLPEKTVRWSPAAVRERDKGICQVSKRKLAAHEGDTGHWIAKAKGGKNTFENTIYMAKELNRLQGTKTPEEMGWNIAKPKAPKTRVKILTVADAKHPDQRPFLIR